MPNATPVIHLDIRKGGSNDPGWVNVPASNGETYGYLYTGGSDSRGGVVMTVGRGADSAPLQLDAQRPRFEIASCVFTNDTNQQLRWNGSKVAGTILDANTAVQNAKYTINVTDTENGNCNIPCDPPIINKPQ